MEEPTADSPSPVEPQLLLPEPPEQSEVILKSGVFHEIFYICIFSHDSNPSGRLTKRRKHEHTLGPSSDVDPNTGTF